jgi:hypothetical protein
MFLSSVTPKFVQEVYKKATLKLAMDSNYSEKPDFCLLVSGRKVQDFKHD